MDTPTGEMFTMEITFLKDVFTMGKKQNNYPKELRNYVCKMVVEDGKKQTDVSYELNIPYDTLHKWVAAYKKQLRNTEKNRQNSLLTATEYQQKLEEEKRRNRELEEENEILKKAMHIFTDEQE
ncbi:transposase [Filobacillus milosensis]|uniref:Transposase n=2 Tax=Filobacillus milosensis TaxID=94137 RepID=A0A4Y8IAD1_9BACI|nr:transposase [Filobacillus milosensis]